MLLADKKAPSGNRPRPRRNPFRTCALTAAFAAIGGKWKLTLLFFLSEGPHHFAGLRARLTISHKVLAQQLRELEADELVSRTPLGRAPAKVMYALTDYGRTLLPLVRSMRAFGRAHQHRLEARMGLPLSEPTRDCP